MSFTEPDSLDSEAFKEKLATSVYDRLLRHGPATPEQLADSENVAPHDAELAVAALRDLRLVRESGEQPGAVVAMTPETAEVELIGPLERAIHSQHLKVAELRQRLETMKITFKEARKAQSHDNPIILLRSPEEIRLRLEQAAQDAQRKVYMMRPGGSLDVKNAQHAFLRILVSTGKNIDIRAVYQHAALSDIRTREYMTELAQSGAAVRTSAEIFDHLTIFDDREAFVPQPTIPGGEGDVIAIIRDPAVIGLLHRVFEHTWCSSAEFRSHTGAYTEKLDDIRSSILTLLSAGFTDDMIARRLGISSRTCRRHVSAIMEQLHAESRFQAGVAVARYGLLPTREKPQDALPI